MSVIASLLGAYEQLEAAHRAPVVGYSKQAISFLIPLNTDGTAAGLPIDLRVEQGRKRVGRIIAVPQPVKRTSGIASNFLWDKSSYVLGLSAEAGPRTDDEHSDFVAEHQRILLSNDDEGLRAVSRFLTWWRPEKLVELGWPEDMKDQNIIFALEQERLASVYLHDRAAARALWAKISAENETQKAICLVTGERGPIARLHPSIKGVWGAQTAGASIVSSNLEAFNSYEHNQGDNAQISEATAFRYTTALNTFLAKDSRNRIQIGDASTVFWAEASVADAAEDAENIFVAMFEAVDETVETRKVGHILDGIRTGKPLEDIAPKLAKSVRFHVLGLAPNAARISIRFWFDNDFGVLARNYQRFVAEMQIEPPPRDGYPALWKYLAETAVLRKRENVPPNLAGEWMRAILTGTAYPQTLLSTVLMRIRADGEINALRVAILKALIIRNFKREAPLSLDPENTNKGYLLGRLFAAYERTQTAALGDKVNATIKDKFYGAASAQPRKVFALLEKGSANHLSKVGKQAPGFKVVLEKAIGGIMEQMSPAGEPFPASLSAQEQALFGLGYYHQRNAFFKPKQAEAAEQ